MNGSPLLKEAIDKLKARGYQVLSYGMIDNDHAKSAQMTHPETYLRAHVTAEEIRFYYDTSRLVRINILPVSPRSSSLGVMESTILEVVNLLVKENL